MLLEDQIETHGRFTRTSKCFENLPRIIVSDDTYSQSKNQEIYHSEVLEKKFWDIYFQRITYTVMSAFALYPDLQEFNIDMIDPLFSELEGQTEMRTVTHTFKRGELQTKFEEIHEHYFPPNENQLN